MTVKKAVPPKPKAAAKQPTRITPKGDHAALAVIPSEQPPGTALLYATVGGQEDPETDHEYAEGVMLFVNGKLIMEDFGGCFAAAGVGLWAMAANLSEALGAEIVKEEIGKEHEERMEKYSYSEALNGRSADSLDMAMWTLADRGLIDYTPMHLREQEKEITE
jgi:hypothetical protein